MSEQNDIKRISGQLWRPGRGENPTRRARKPYDLILNGYDMLPHYIQAGIGAAPKGAPGAGGYGAFRFQENIKPVPYKRLFPHTHPCHEYFLFWGINPDNPDDIGGTVEFWLGAEENAEPYLITKPTIVDVPPNTGHLPEIFRNFHGPNAGCVIHDAPLWSVGVEYNSLHPACSVNKLADISKFPKIYQQYINEKDISKAALYPSHKGKSQVVLHNDMRHNQIVTHTTEINLVSSAGIGWGCGDLMQFPDYQARSLPHLHDALEIYCFWGTDPNDTGNLGASLEFWMGEGENAQKIIIEKPTILCVPPNVVHLPLYVNKLDRPMIIMSLLDSPIWTGYYTDIFPPIFDFVNTPNIPQMKIKLEYEKEKCLYPECQICMDQCAINGIDLSQDPPVIGKPCLSCGTCDIVCPTRAIRASGLIEA